MNYDIIASMGATSYSTVAVGPLTRVFLPSFVRKGAMPMVTWTDLIQIMILMVALAGLFYEIGKRK